MEVDKNIRFKRLLDFVNRYERPLTYSAYALILLAVLTGFGYVYVYSINLIWWDEWDELPPMFYHYASGTLTFNDFWSHNEHRFLFPNLIMLGTGLLTDGNTIINMYVTEFLLVANLAIFVFAFRRQFSYGPALWLMVPIAFVVFSLRQCENMLWGFQIGFVLPIVGSLFAFLQISRISNKRHTSMLIGAVLSATFASYSSFQGLLVWPVGMGQLFILQLDKRLKIRLMMIWAVVSIAEYCLYFYNWHGSYHEYAFSLRYLVTAIGGLLWDTPTKALIAGIGILVLMVVAIMTVFIRRQWATQSFWLAAICFSFAIMLTVTVGRSALGIEQALSSRYSSFSIPLVVATCVILASQIHEKRGYIYLLLMGVLLAMSIQGTAISFSKGIDAGRGWRIERKWQQFVLYTIDSQPNDLLGMFWAKDRVRKYTAYLKKLKYSIFADAELCARFELPDPSLPSIEVPTKCAIEGVTPMENGKYMSIDGWAVDWPAQELAGSLAVVINGVEHQTCYGLHNDNAVVNLDDRKYQDSGFKCVVPAEELAEGKNSVTLKILSHDRKGVYTATVDVDVKKRSAP